MEKHIFAVVDFENESFPFMYYKRIGGFFDPMYINFLIDPGYCFYLHEIRARYSNENTNLPGAYADPPRFQIIRDPAIFNIFPFDIPLLSSPGEANIQVDMVNPARPMTAPDAFTRSVKMHVLYRFREVLTIKVSNFTILAVPANPDFSLPSYIEIAAIGRLHPVSQ